MALPAAALAQTQGGQAAPTDAKAAKGQATVDEVVVTAQMREQSLQDVPISAVVLSGKMAAEQNLNNLNTLSQALPSVHVGLTPTSADLYVRGTGSGANPTFAQAVGTFIDGVYYGRSRISSAAFFDLNQIEVLKGPQSTFFGNNAIAGAFNIGTKQPTASFTGDARLLYGSFGDRVAEVAAGGPLSDQLEARLAVHYDGSDGWLDKVPTPRSGAKNMPEQDNLGGRLTLLWKPVDQLSVQLKTEFSRSHSNGSGLQGTRCPPQPPFAAAGFCLTNLNAGLGGAIGLDKNAVTSSPGTFSRLQTEAEVLTVNYDLAEHRFTSISAHTHYNYNQALDVDGTPQNLASAGGGERYDQISQEFRLTSPTGNRLEYLAGLYFQDDHLSFAQQISFPYLNPVIGSVAAFASIVPLLPIAQVTDFGQHEWTASAFGSATWHITDKLLVTGGLRYTLDHKAFDNVLEFGSDIAPYNGYVLFSGTLNPQNNGAVVSTGLQGLASAIGLGPAGTEKSAKSYDAFTPSLKAQYQLQPGVMAYLSYSRGFLAGGFNGIESTGIAANAAYAPEFADAYEAGLKSKLFGGSVILDADVFYSKYTDFQVVQSIQQFGGIRNVVTNAASVITRGVEADAVWRVTDDFQINGDVAYDNAYFGSYSGVAQDTLGVYCHAHVGNSVCVSRYGGKGDPGATRDLSGQTTPFAPKWSGRVTASYRIHAGELLVTPSVTTVFSSSYFPSGSQLDDPLEKQPAYVRLDAQLSVAKDGDGRWAIDIIGKNLTNANIITTALGWTNSAGSIWEAKEEPRNVAVQLRLNW